MTIVRGTTAAIEYTFKTVDPTDIVTAYLNIKQLGNTVIERDLATSTIDNGKLRWTLTQEESLSLSCKSSAFIYLDYVLSDGLRISGKTTEVIISQSGKNEVI